MFFLNKMNINTHFVITNIRKLADLTEDESFDVCVRWWLFGSGTECILCTLLLVIFLLCCVDLRFILGCDLVRIREVNNNNNNKINNNNYMLKIIASDSHFGVTLHAL